MVTPASPYTDMFQLATAGFAEGQSALAEASEMRGDVGRPSIAYGYQALTSGFIQIEAAARRYVSQPECAAGAASMPILTDQNFRAAVTACADQLDRAVPHVGVPAQRIAAALRRFTADNNPAEARLIAMACDAGVRMSKMKASRAA